jgi:hypothetical protein
LHDKILITARIPLEVNIFPKELEHLAEVFKSRNTIVERIVCPVCKDGLKQISNTSVKMSQI